MNAPGVSEHGGGGEAGDYTPGALDQSAPARIWLQIDTAGDNAERDEAFPHDNWEHVSWCQESVGGLEIQYVRADLATTPPTPSAPVVDDAHGFFGNVMVGNATTLTQEDYPGLGQWWVQLRIGPKHDTVLARVYADDLDSLRARANAIAMALNEWPKRAALSVVSAPVGVIGDAIRHLSKWLDCNECECESGHQCGRTEVERTRDQLRALTPTAAAPMVEMPRIESCPSCHRSLEKCDEPLCPGRVRNLATPAASEDGLPELPAGFQWDEGRDITGEPWLSIKANDGGTAWSGDPHGDEANHMFDLIRRLAATGHRDCVLTPILAELTRATAKFPTWPTDPLHALGVLGEEFGELGKAVLQAVYEPHKGGDVREEAIQTAAMAIRFVASLDRYVFAPCQQHLQSVTQEPIA